MTKPRLLTIVQAARRHRSPERTIHNLIKRGKLPSTGEGYNRRVLLADVDKLVTYHARGLDWQEDVPDPVIINSISFTAREVKALSYCFTVAIIVGKLVGIEKQIVRDVQKKIFDIAVDLDVTYDEDEFTL